MILDLGLIGYGKAYDIQKELVLKRKSGEIEDSLILLEHRSVFTIGRRGDLKNLLVDADILKKEGIEVARADRGGDITFHGPGQLVLYPIVDLKERVRDLHLFLRDLEELAINFLSEYGICPRRRTGKTGVWVGPDKISSIGIAASNWVTYHGLSININVDLKYFSMIYACGIKDAGAVSVASILNRRIAMSEAKEKAAYWFNRIFGKKEEYFAESYSAAVA